MSGDNIGDTFGTMKTHQQQQDENARAAKAKADREAEADARRRSEAGFMSAKGLFDSGVVIAANAIADAPSKIIDGISSVQNLAESFFGTIGNLNSIANQGLGGEPDSIKPAQVELSPSAQRGSREEYALIAKMSASNANDAEAARHNELLKKQDEVKDLWTTGIDYLSTLANAAGGVI